MSGAANPWDTAWVSIRFRSIDTSEVSYLRWFAAVGDDRLVMLVAGDDPMLKQADLEYEVDVAAVRRRGQVGRSRRYLPAKLEVLNKLEIGWVDQKLNQKYAGKRRIFRPAAWLVRMLDGSRGRRPDVPIRLELSSTRSPDEDSGK